MLQSEEVFIHTSWHTCLFLHFFKLVKYVCMYGLFVYRCPWNNTIVCLVTRLERDALHWRGGSSDLLDLLPDHNGVVAANLLCPELPVVKRAVVLVRVPVHWAEQAPTSALEPWNTTNKHYYYMQTNRSKTSQSKG